MNNITNVNASANILAACARGALIQQAWHGSDETACLLGSMHPSINSTGDCNRLMPWWLPEASLTMFDGIATKHVLSVARWYGELVGRWHVLTERQWDLIMTRLLTYCIDLAVSAARSSWKYQHVIENACSQCRAAVVSGNDSDLAAARSVASEAVDIAWFAGAKEACSAARTAWSAARSAVRAAIDSAAAAAKNSADAYFSLFTFTLEQIEYECDLVGRA